jgi:hypothetical protein
LFVGHFEKWKGEGSKFKFHFFCLKPHIFYSFNFILLWFDELHELVYFITEIWLKAFKCHKESYECIFFKKLKLIWCFKFFTLELFFQIIIFGLTNCTNWFIWMWWEKLAWNQKWSGNE